MQIARSFFFFNILLHPRLQLSYSLAEQATADTMEDALQKVGLPELAKKLDEPVEWHSILSQGEGIRALVILLITISHDARQRNDCALHVSLCGIR